MTFFRMFWILIESGMNNADEESMNDSISDISWLVKFLWMFKSRTLSIADLSIPIVHPLDDTSLSVDMGASDNLSRVAE